jgi:hypothetical protein
MTTMMKLCPAFDLGTGLRKSMLMDCHGQVGGSKGSRRLYVGWFGNFVGGGRS